MHADSRRTLSHYRLIEKIGEGGMGQVWEAEDTVLRRRVALKFLTTTPREQENTRARFLREARTAAALNHPNVCTVHEVTEVQQGEELDLDGVRLEAGTPYIAMELVEGRTLAGLLKEEGQIARDDLLRIAGQVAEGLAAAHKRGVVHRDLKPANVMITKESRAKILDFGVARWAQSITDGETTRGSSTGLTGSGYVVGTIAYMSPEQARGESVDSRSDIFSFGVMLYELAAGESPFRASGALSTVDRILETEPEPLAPRRPDLPPDLARIVHRCLNKRPEDRYNDTTDLVAALRNASSSTESAGRRPAQRWWPVVAATGVVAVAVIAGVFFLGRDRGGNEGLETTSVAVLPCVATGGQAMEDYFTEGITVDIITQLSKIGSLKVISPTSTFKLKETDRTESQIASELGVATLLRCETMQIADRFRIAVHLVDPADGSVMWADTYDREAEDVLSIWSDVALQVAGELRATLSPSEQKVIARHPRVHPAAYREYQQGRKLWRERKRAGLEKAVDHFQRAIAYDPDYALAYAGLADAYGSIVHFSYGAVPFEAYREIKRETDPKAKDAAARAMKLDPTLAGPHAATGYRLRYWDREEAERHLRRAIELEPGYVWAHTWYGRLLSSQGRHEEAIAELELAVSLDPLVQVIHADLGFALAFAREYERAIDKLQATIAMDPSWPHAYGFLGDAYLWSGQYRKAEDAYTTFFNLVGDDPGPIKSVMLALVGAVPVEEAIPLVDEIAKTHGPTTAGEIYAALGESELALDMLERAFELRDPQLPSRILREPLLDPIRSDPRYLALLEKTGHTPPVH